MEPELSNWHREPVTHDRAYAKEPDDHQKSFGQVVSVGALMVVRHYLSKEFPRHVQIEYGGHSDGSKPASESCLLPIFELMDLLSEEKDHGQPPQEKDENSERD